MAGPFQQVSRVYQRPTETYRSGTAQAEPSGTAQKRGLEAAGQCDPTPHGFADPGRVDKNRAEVNSARDTTPENNRAASAETDMTADPFARFA